MATKVSRRRTIPIRPLLLGIEFSLSWRCGKAPSDKTRDFGGRELVLLGRKAQRSCVGGGGALGAAIIVVRLRWGKRRGRQADEQSASGLVFRAKFDCNVAVVVPNEKRISPGIWAFCSFNKLQTEVRRLTRRQMSRTRTLIKIPFDMDAGRRSTRDEESDGLTDAPVRTIRRNGCSTATRRVQSSLSKSPSLDCSATAGRGRRDRSSWTVPRSGPDGLESHADDDGIVCISAIKGEDAAADRLRALLAAACGDDWNAGQLNTLLAEVGFAGKSLDDWLRDGFFEQHCELFHHRPFIWHVWDGRRRVPRARQLPPLVAPNGQGRRTLEKLTYTYLGDWIDRQRDDQKAASTVRTAASPPRSTCRRSWTKILEGEPPYDLFVRWKPLHSKRSAGSRTSTTACGSTSARS